MSHDLVGGRFVTVDEDFDEGDFLLNPEPEPTYSPEESLFRQGSSFIILLNFSNFLNSLKEEFFSK